MKTQTNLSSLLLISFALFFQMGCGSNITKMIDQLSLDPQYVNFSQVKLSEEQDSQNILRTVQTKLHDITKGQGAPNDGITLNNQQPTTLLELMIQLEAFAGVQFPPKLLRYLSDKGMDIEKPISVIRVLRKEEKKYRYEDSPLDYAIQCSAANIARWLLKTRWLLKKGADVSTVTCIDASALWKGTYTSVNDKVALLDALKKRGFNFNKNITPEGIKNLVIEENMSVDDKIQLLAVLKKYGVDFKQIHYYTYCACMNLLDPASYSIIDFLLPISEDLLDNQIADHVRLLAALVEHGCDFNAADKMGYQLLQNMVIYEKSGSYHTQFLEKILEGPKDVGIRGMLYDTLFIMDNFDDYYTDYLLWEYALQNGNIELAVLLIKEIKPEDVKTKFLIYANGEECRDFHHPLTQLDRIQEFETRFTSLSCADRQKIRQAFRYIGIQEGS